jgi:hypothetical protein
MFNSAYRALILFSSFFFIGCSFLKLDPETNCLNDKAACFKEDKTRPSFVQTVLPAPGVVVSTLGEVQLLFSEELNNPQPSDFFYSEPGLTVQSVTKIDKFTYRLLNNRNPNQGGPLTLTFNGLKDYAGNSITNGSITYTINLNIPVTPTATHTGVSTVGYPTVSVSWRFSYTPVIAGDTVYHVRLTTGAEDCNAGSPITPATATPLVNSAVQTYDDTNSTTIAATTYNFTVNTAVITSLGAQKILICLNNTNNNKFGIGVINVVRDDTVPDVLTVSPVGGNYVAAQTLTFTCSDNADKIIHNVASNVFSGTDPLASAVAEPTFDTGTGAVTNGTLYDANNKPVTPYSGDTTRSIYKYRCIDKAGNITPPNASAALVSGVYRINSTFPTVTLASLTKTGANPAVNISGVGAGGYTSATLAWRTNQVGQAWEIRSGGTDCGVGGTIVAQGSGGTATPSPANTTILTNILDTSPGIAVGLNNLRVCVTNGSEWGQAGFTLLRDDTAPSTLTVNVPPGDYGTVQNLVFSCSDNEDRVIFTESFSAPGASPADPGDPLFDADGRRINGTLHTGPHAVTSDDSSLIGKRTRIKYRCIDKTGHVTAVNDVTYTIDTLLPTITVQNQNHTAVSAQPGANGTLQLTWVADRQITGYDIRRGSTNCNDGTVLTSGTNLSNASVLAAGTPVTSTINANLTNFAVGEATYTIHICTSNSIGSKGYTSRTIKYDNTAPTFAGLTSLSSSGSGNFTLNWSAATDGAGSGIAYYNIYRADNLGGPYVTAQHMAAHPATSINVTVPVATNTYYYVAGAVDNAGNETKVTVAEFATKPTIRLLVSGLDTGNAKTFNLTDGVASATVSANSNAPGAIWATTLAMNDTYNLAVTSQPSGQVCAIRERQFGTLTADVTINIECVTGQMVAGHFQAYAPNAMDYFVQRTSAEVWVSTFAVASEYPNSVTVVANAVYYGTSGDCEAGASVRYCIYYRSVASAGAGVLFLNNIPGEVRGITNDGSNIYFTTIAPDNKLYKASLTGSSMVEIASGLNNPYAIVLDGHDVFIANRAADEIVRVDVRTGVKTTIQSGIDDPIGIAVVGSDLYFTRSGQHAIYTMPKTGGAPTAAYGSATPGRVDGVGAGARLREPHDLIYDGVGNLFVSEYGNHDVRRIRLSTQRVTTLVGDSSIAAMTYQNGTGATAQLPRPVGMASDGRHLYVSLHGDRRIVKLSDVGFRGHWPLTEATALRDHNPGITGGTDASWVTGSASYAADRFGGTSALVFNGTDTQLRMVGIHTAGSACNVSLAAWVRVAVPATAASRVIVHNGDSGVSGFGLMLNDQGQISALFGGQGIINSSYAVGANEWVHAALVCRPTNRWEVYVNGRLMAVGDGSLTKRPNNSATPALFVGKGAGAASEYLNGAISDVRFYTRPLSEGEINEIAQGASSAVLGNRYNNAPTELIAHYQMAGGGPDGALNASLAGAGTPTTGKDGDVSSAYTFDQTSSLAVSGSALNALPLDAAPRTLCAYIRPTSYPNASDFVSPVSYGTAGALNEFGLALSRDAGANVFIANTFNSAQDHVFGHKVALNAWTHFCATYDGTDSRLYVDGQLMSTKTVAINTSVAVGSLRVGAWFADTHRFAGRRRRCAHL